MRNLSNLRDIITELRNNFNQVATHVKEVKLLLSDANQNISQIKVGDKL